MESNGRLSHCAKHTRSEKKTGGTGQTIADRLKSIQCSEEQVKDSAFWQSPHLLQGYGQVSTVKVQTVTKALAAISKTIELAGGKSPIYVDHRVYTTPIQRMIDSFRRQDPPAVAQLAVPVEWKESTCNKHSA